MIGYVLCITDDDVKRNRGSIGWKYVKEHRSEMETFDFEESSIDLGVSSEPRFVINDKPYSFYKQYFEKTGNRTNRIVVIKEAKDNF